MLLRPILFRATAPPSRAALLQSTAAMPLRAKITNPAIASQQQKMSVHQAAEIPREQPGDTPDDVVFNSSYNIRTIELNRPKKLNSLDGSMIRKIAPRLAEWSKSDMITAVIMKGAGEKALCAGGDVAILAQWNQEGPEGRQRSKDYFALEYKLDHLIATYNKPYISLMDGITMGGGVGLSMHAPFRIATERTVFAMPETTIGFFPEVGGSFFLPRLDGALGKYLALTSERLKGVQAYYHGIASHYLHSSSLPDLERRLAEITIPDYASADERLRIINNAISEFVTGSPDEPIQLSGELRKLIDSCFSRDTVEGIFAGLEDAIKDDATPAALKKWAEKTIATMKERSPTSLRVTNKQMQYGAGWDIATAFDREHRIAARFMDHPDFTEGVSARLIRKPAEKPVWQPANISDVSEEDADAFFKINPGDAPPLQLLTSTTYQQYPHAWLSLPSEKSILTFAKSGSLTRKDVIDHFAKQTNYKLGVAEKVNEVLDRAGV